MDKKTVAALFFVGILAAILIIVFIEHSMNPPEKQPAPVETRQPAVRQAEQGEQVEQAGQAPQAELDEQREAPPMMQEFDNKTGEARYLR